jgi:hypothetical protein
VHLCFGYAAVVHDKPSGYSFLAELEGSKAQQISIEAAQPKLDLKVLRELPSKTIILGVIDLADMTVETPQIVADRIRAALPCAGRADCGGAGLRHEIPAARGRLRQNEGDGRGRGARAARARWQDDVPEETFEEMIMPYVTEKNLTDVVRERWSDIPDPRLKQVMQALVKHVHAFVREIEPTRRNGRPRSISSPAPASCATTSARNSS